MTNRCTTYGQGAANLGDAIRHCRTFRTGGALSGLRGATSLTPSTGSLDPETRARLLADIDAADNKASAEGHPNGYWYIVYSYATPIAWATSATDWRLVGAKFSPTTSRHQALVSKVVHGDTSYVTTI